MVGGGRAAGTIGNSRVFEVCWSGFRTCTDAIATAVRSEPGTVATSEPGGSKRVGRSAPFQVTTEPETKPLPLTVNGKAGLPTVTESADRLVITGGESRASITNVRAVETC